MLVGGRGCGQHPAGSWGGTACQQAEAVHRVLGQKTARRRNNVPIRKVAAQPLLGQGHDQQVRREQLEGSGKCMEARTQEPLLLRGGGRDMDLSRGLTSNPSNSGR